MQRRTFLQIAPWLAADIRRILAAEPMPMATLGKTGLKVSRFTLGGYHFLRNGEEEAIRIVHRAIDLGVNFFDSAHKYNNGRSDEVYGKALAGGLRQKVLLMSKAEQRDRDGAMRQLEETLKRMRTDYLDLWQCHEVSTHEEVDRILGPNGALEAFVKAKEQGKVRHIGFTGHHDPSVHQRLLEAFDGWETVQHPVNLVDPHYLSFIEQVLPKAKAKGLGVIAMKSNAMGSITRQGVATIQECLRFAWSQPIDTLVSGVETVTQLEENIAVLKTLKQMSTAEIKQLLERTARGPHGPTVERYKKPTQAASFRVHRDGEPV